jgi:hypothetical protein
VLARSAVLCCTCNHLLLTHTEYHESNTTCWIKCLCCRCPAAVMHCCCAAFMHTTTPSDTAGKGDSAPAVLLLPGTEASLCDTTVPCSSRDVSKSCLPGHATLQMSGIGAHSRGLCQTGQCRGCEGRSQTRGPQHWAGCLRKQCAPISSNSLHSSTPGESNCGASETACHLQCLAHQGRCSCFHTHAENKHACESSFTACRGEHSIAVGIAAFS